jgi:hypothetical protein
MKRFTSLLWIASLMSICFSVSSAQSVYYVNALTGNNITGNGSIGNPFKTISKALAISATVGDSIKVAAGNYNKALGEAFPIVMLTGRKLIATAGAVTTIIDASGSKNRVFNCSGNSNSTIIQGFTITGGFAIDTISGGVTSKGGGILIDNNSQTIIQQNIITKDTARGYDFYQAGLGALNGGSCYGGGIYIAGASPTIRNNIISYNVAIGGGGQDYRGGWSGNGSAGGNADGGGIHAAFGGATSIFNNTFYSNKAVGGLGGASNSLNAGSGGNAVSGALDAGSNAIVKNNIFSNNSAVAGPAGGGLNGTNGTSIDGAVTSFSAPNLSNNLYFNNTAGLNPNGGTLGTNNLLTDPLFVSTTNFHLQLNSPARKAGTATDAPIIDFDGITRTNPPSIGAYDGSGPTSVDDQNINTLKEFALEQNFPNPFNPSTVISYQIPVNNHVSLKVYDAIGREVATLVNEVKEAGKYSATFNASKLSSGIYFAKLQSGDKVLLKKMLLIK